MADFTVKQHPFPHVVDDDLWEDEYLKDVIAEFPSPKDRRWRRYGNGQERKFEGPLEMWGPHTIGMFEEIEQMAPDLERAFGIEGLQMETVGGGYHLIPPGGYLARHADFNVSPFTGHFRRLNFLVYLNMNWRDQGGKLELGAPDDPTFVEYAPTFNRTVVFETSDTSWHGHPVPTNRWRFSVAAYFYTEEPPAGFTSEHSTVWFPDAA